MATQPPDPEIEKLLAELRSDAAFRRIAAAQDIAALRLDNDEVIAALKAMSETDVVIPARQAAANALKSLSEPPVAGRPPVARRPSPPAAPAEPAPPLSRREKVVQFVDGFVGWYLINGIAWLSLTGGHGANANGEFDLLPGLCLFPVNLIVLIGLARTRRWSALGVLSALALNLLVALVLGVGVGGFCFVPFFALH